MAQQGQETFMTLQTSTTPEIAFQQEKDNIEVHIKTSEEEI